MFVIHKILNYRKKIKFLEYNYNITNNIAINQGEGLDYNLSQRKDVAHLIFEQYILMNNTRINFSNNYVYNPIRLFLIKPNDINNTNFFKTTSLIQFNFNKYYLNKDTTCIGDSYKYSQFENFITDFNKDKNSNFSLLNSIDENIVNKAQKSYDYNEIRSIFINQEKLYKEHSFLYLFVQGSLVFLALLGVIFFIRYITKKNTASLNEIDYNMVIN